MKHFNSPKSRRATAASLALSFALIVGVGPVSSASASHEIDVDLIMSALGSTAGIQGIPSVLENRAEVRSASVDTSSTRPRPAEVPTSSARPVTFQGAEGPLSIYLPGTKTPAVALHDGLVGFDTGTGATTVPIAKDDGSVQIISVIDSENSSTTYKYKLDLPPGATLSEGPDKVITVINKDGDHLAGVAQPWAIDAKGASVPTWFSTEGNTLVQHVQHGSAYTYPVVADPWLGGIYVQSWSWFAGAVRISMVPTTFAQYVCFANFSCAFIYSDSAKAELATAQVTTANRNKINKWTTRNQIGCHMFVGPFKSPWNLETNVPDIGLAGFIAAECNP